MKNRKEGPGGMGCAERRDENTINFAKLKKRVR